jgi:hypothetical protein
MEADWLRSIVLEEAALSLRGKRIGDSGLRALALALAGSDRTLTSLDLEFCDISDLGAAALAGLLSETCALRLRALDLSNNR